MSNKIRASGGIRIDLELIYYPLGEYWYAVNYKGLKAVVQAKPVFELEEGEKQIKNKKKRILYWELPMNDSESLIFDDNPIGKDMPYNNPIDVAKAEEWFSMKKCPDIDEIYMDIKKVLQQCYDFSDERDLDVAILFILQSWFSDILKGVFYVDVRSQMGGGKTILLELMQGLSRYGVLANDMSFAVIPRMVDRYKCTLFFDEIDMINKHVIDDVFKILRTGYRKGQKYIRAKPKTFEPETFDCYGSKAFNYRSDIADDLKNRSLPINTSKSQDKTLPMLNLYKEQFLKPIFFKIFCYYMNSLSRITAVECLLYETVGKMENYEKVNMVKDVNELLVNTDTDKYTTSSMRNTFLSNISHFNRFSLTLLTANEGNGGIIPNNSESENLDYMNKLIVNLTGRSIEIFALVMHLCSYLGLDISKNFKELLEEKAEFEDHDEEDLKNILREILLEQEVGAGIHKASGMKFRYYRDIQSSFMNKVHEHYGFKPNTGSMKRFLRELGFVDKISKKVMKFGENETALCLIYDDKIRKNLGLLY